ncbi:hypothetical protein SAMN05444671_2018 [Flavobacterium sp. CF108]|uniref:hypothetical protein n=1 Tax=unclassified Flavobacterium TaxID=196869 RepID=UPI0008B97C55|nr:MULTISPECIES: hypothetical protein [unclassified Flavobacterium]SEN64901.1 hypothetical protein SAMN04487978_1334 [Flavobacterium sp. fv08]SHH05945.1 hypothetical protein SAMN05444671_2018 [Flavobacterium sp. CF108]
MIKKENVLKFLILVILLTVMAFWANYLSGSEAFYKRALENSKEESYSGIVLEKYIDSSQHCTPMLKFTSSSSNAVVNSFWDEVEVGDSIVKVKGQSSIYLYKNNQLKQVFDYKVYYQSLMARKSKN